MYGQASCKHLVAVSTNGFMLLPCTHAFFDKEGVDLRSKSFVLVKITACTSYLTKEGLENAMPTAIAVRIIYLYLANEAESHGDG